MCIKVHRVYHCGHEEDLTITCGNQSTLALITNPINEGSRNIPSVIDDRAMVIQFLLNGCISQSDLPREERKSTKLCDLCASTTYHITRPIRESSDNPENPSVKAPLIGDLKPMKWRDENGQVWDVREKTKRSMPPVPPKDGAGDDKEEHVPPSSMSLYDPILWKWKDKDGNELVTPEEKELLIAAKTKEKTGVAPGLFPSMKESMTSTASGSSNEQTVAEKRSVSGLGAMFQSLTSTTPEKSGGPPTQPNWGQRSVSSSLLGAFQSMTFTPSTPKTEIPAEKKGYSALRAAARKSKLSTPRGSIDQQSLAHKKSASGLSASDTKSMASTAKESIDKQGLAYKKSASGFSASGFSASGTESMASTSKGSIDQQNPAYKKSAPGLRALGNESLASTPKGSFDEQKSRAQEEIASILLSFAQESMPSPEKAQPASAKKDIPPTPEY